MENKKDEKKIKENEWFTTNGMKREDKNNGGETRRIYLLTVDYLKLFALWAKRFPDYAVRYKKSFRVIALNLNRNFSILLEKITFPGSWNGKKAHRCTRDS